MCVYGGVKSKWTCDNPLTRDTYGKHTEENKTLPLLTLYNSQLFKVSHTQLPLFSVSYSTIPRLSLLICYTGKT